MAKLKPISELTFEDGTDWNLVGSESNLSEALVHKAEDLGLFAKFDDFEGPAPVTLPELSTSPVPGNGNARIFTQGRAAFGLVAAAGVAAALVAGAMQWKTDDAAQAPIQTGPVVTQVDNLERP